jgi:hypothetical protein
LSASIFATLLLVGVCAPATFAAAPAARAAVPKVVFVVGPSGAATDGYRAQSRVAASIARHYTPDVTELYSPDATWPAVKAAVKGASLVVYMGHGNGWPSRYRDDLFPATQNGLGLNPTPDGSDSTHQYFGEALVGSELKLAKHAVVLLNHLCYASGNTEPGLLEGTLTQDLWDFSPPGKEPYRTPILSGHKLMLDVFDRNIATARRAIEATSDDAFMKNWSLLYQGNTIFTMPRIAVLRSFILNHTIHHRAILTVYLRLNDIPVPALYGPSGDEQ